MTRIMTETIAAGNRQPKEHILSGYKVLDFTQHIAGPTATRLLVEMGPGSSRSELAPDGEPSRRAPYMKGRSGAFIQQNRGKRAYAWMSENPKDSSFSRACCPR
jgi:CoA:oxalate CoA-transferase